MNAKPKASNAVAVQIQLRNHVCCNLIVQSKPWLIVCCQEHFQFAFTKYTKSEQILRRQLHVPFSAHFICIVRIIERAARDFMTSTSPRGPVIELI